MDRGLDLIAFGPVFVEFVFGAVAALPSPGDEVYADEFASSCGGAVSVASAASAIGAVAGVATVLGKDLGTSVVEAHCALTGVDLSPSRRVAGSASGVTAVLNCVGTEPAFLSHLPLSGRPARSPAWWSAVVATYRPRWVYLHACDGALRFIEDARRAGSLVAVDTELGTVRRAPEVVCECAGAADIFVPNLQELACLTGTGDLADAVRALAAPGTTVVVTLGADGAAVAEEGRLVQLISGVQGGAEVRDCTGAGDAFAGAMLGSLAMGSPLADAVDKGNAAGSAAVARLGAVGPICVSCTGEGHP